MLYGHVETYAGPHGAPRRCCATCRTRPAGSSPTSRSPITRTTTSWARRCTALGTATTGFDDLKNLAVGRLFLDNFEHIKSHWIMVHAVRVADVAALRRERSRGHRRSREDLPRGRRAHRAGDDARPAAAADSRRQEGARRARFVLQRHPHVRRRGRPPRRRPHDAPCESGGSRTSTATRSTAPSTAAWCR